MVATLVPYARTPYRDAALFPSIQDAIDDLPSSGGTIWVPSGTHMGGITTTKANLEIYGAGGSGQDSLLGVGATVIEVASGDVGLTIGSALVTSFRGPVVGGIHFRALAGAIGGLQLLRSNNWRLERVVASGFSSDGSYGIRSDGTGNANQYGSLDHCSAHNCRVGLDIIASNGIEDFGGYYDGNSNGSGSPSGQPSTGSIGIRLAGGDSLRLFGTRIQFYEKGVVLADGSKHEIHGGRVEAFGANGVGLEIGADYCSIIGANINNYITGGGGTGISILPTADKTTIVVPPIESTMTAIADAGTNTVALHNLTLQVPTNFLVRWGNDAIISRSGLGQVKAQTNFYVGASIVVDSDNQAGRLVFGIAQDVGMQRTAANILAMLSGDKFVATSGLGVGNSVIGSSLGECVRKMEVFDANGESLGYVPIYDAIT